MFGSVLIVLLLLLGPVRGQETYPPGTFLSWERASPFLKKHLCKGK